MNNVLYRSESRLDLMVCWWLLNMWSRFLSTSCW